VELLIMHFFHPPITSSLFDPNILRSILFTNTPNLWDLRFSRQCRVDLEDGDSMFLRSVGLYLQVHTALRPRRPTSTSSPPWYLTSHAALQIDSWVI
jgi:hypothetical protein